MSSTRFRIGPWKVMCGGMTRKEGNGLEGWPAVDDDMDAVKDAVARAGWMNLGDLAGATFGDRIVINHVLEAMASCLPKGHYADVEVVEMSTGPAVGRPHLQPQIRIKSTQ